MNDQYDKTPTFFRFEDLRIYHKALDYIDWVMRICKEADPSDKTGLMQAFNHAARQIAVNISEGSARNKAQFVFHLKNAKSAIRECLVLTTVCLRNGIINEESEDASRNQLMEMTKMLGALITSLQKAAQNSHDNYDEDDAPNRNW
ncbi:MAG: four helix bundle protein [Bacteroidetes bacterium]|nr:four helix bundle protein [Bacteroidales bacterium]MBU1010922.1 four helix bundle protein [Bacteroidota bacterium]